MPETMLEVGSLQSPLQQLQLQKLVMKLLLYERPRRRLRQNLSQRQMQPLYYHLHNQSNMPKAKGKVNELREVIADQHHLAQRTRRRSRVISTSQSNPASMVRIVPSAMIRRSSRTPRKGMAKARARASHQGKEHLPILRRRLMSLVGIGLRAHVSLVTHVEGVMILTCSTLLRTPVFRLRRPWYMTSTVMMM